MSLGLRLRLMADAIGDRYGAFCDWRARHSSKRMRKAFLVRLAVDATAEPLIGSDAYAGPDGVDYERMWWATEGKLPPGREAEITAPV